MKKWLQYLIIFLVTSALALCVMLIQGTFAMEGQRLFAGLSDAFFASGALVLCLGLLIVATNGGTFDMLAYGIMKLFDLFKKDLTKVKYRTFYDYQKAQEGKERSFWAYVVVGAVFVLISVIFFLLYKNYQ